MEKYKHKPSIEDQSINLNEQPENERIIESILEDLNYINSSVENINSGDVHYVFKVVSPNKDNCYIKIRRDHFKSNKNVLINPKDISIEKDSIDLLNKNFPGVAPKIFGFYENYSAMCLEDVAEVKTTVSDLIVKSRPEDYSNLGDFLGELHKSFLGHNVKIRGVKKESFYKDSLYYRLGFLKIPAIDRLVSSLYDLPKQNIHGDLTPWNIVWNENNKSFRLYDLETVHYGNRVFDLAFLEAHIILEMFSKKELFTKLLFSFRKGYENTFSDTDENLEVRLAFGLTLLRLKGNSTYSPRNQYDHEGLEKYALEIVKQPNKNLLKWNSLPEYE